MTSVAVGRTKRPRVAARLCAAATRHAPTSLSIIRLAEREGEVWIEWRMAGTRVDGTVMEFVGVNIFGVEDDTFRWGRIYTELTRDAGGIEAQLERMTGGNAPA